MYLGDEKADVCDPFSRFFRSVYVPDDSLPPTSGVSKSADVYSYILTESEVMKAVQCLDATKGDGPDNVSPLSIRNCSESLLLPLHYIFNLSLSSPVFPSRWKSSYLTPVHKSGYRSDVTNYGGIAILPTLAKLF